MAAYGSVGGEKITYNAVAEMPMSSWRPGLSISGFLVLYLLPWTLA